MPMARTTPANGRVRQLRKVPQSGRFFRVVYCYFTICLCDLEPVQQMVYDPNFALESVSTAKTTAISVPTHASEIDRPRMLSTLRRFTWSSGTERPSAIAANGARWAPRRETARGTATANDTNSKREQGAPRVAHGIGGRPSLTLRVSISFAMWSGGMSEECRFPGRIADAAHPSSAHRSFIS